MTRHDRLSRHGIRAAATLALTLLAACSQDELTTNGDTLPEGLYPVEIASVTIGGEDNVQPWGTEAPQTRATESGDGKTTWWQDGDIFYVKFSGSDNTGRIRQNGNTSITTLEPLYWRSATQEETLISWLTQPETVSGGTIDISDQTSRLAYVCHAEETVKYNGGNIIINLKHQLAKVRVYVQGTGYEGDATGVTINNVPASCTVTDGVPVAEASTAADSIQMYKTTVNNAVCFEANVLPGTLKKANAFTVTIGTTEHKISLDSDLTLTAATVNTVSLRLQKDGTEVVYLSALSNTYEINDSRTYFFYGTNTYGIKVTSGSPKIYLANVTINASDGNAIDITGGSPTINIQGNVSVKSSNGAGIFVAQNNTVTIRSSGRNDNMLTAEAGGEAAGIGGTATNGTGTNCGNITIKDIRLYAYGSSVSGGACPGIGGADSGTCGTITIENSAVYAYGTTSGNNHAPAIGSAQPANGESPAAPSINISGGDILYAYRGGTGYASSNADYIGRGGSASSKRSGDISITSGKSCQIWGLTSGSNSSEKTVWYNAEGNIM